MTILSLSRMGTDLRQADKASFFVPGTVDMVGRRCWAALLRQWRPECLVAVTAAPLADIRRVPSYPDPRTAL
jgi:hypothetical protein